MILSPFKLICSTMMDHSQLHNHMGHFKVVEGKNLLELAQYVVPQPITFAEPAVPIVRGKLHYVEQRRHHGVLSSMLLKASDY